MCQVHRPPVHLPPFLSRLHTPSVRKRLAQPYSQHNFTIKSYSFHNSTITFGNIKLHASAISSMPSHAVVASCLTSSAAWHLHRLPPCISASAFVGSSAFPHLRQSSASTGPGAATSRRLVTCSVLSFPPPIPVGADKQVNRLKNRDKSRSRRKETRREKRKQMT